MKYKYQLILLGSLDELSERLTTLFFEKVKELHLPADAFRVIKEDNFKADYTGNQPAFAIYFGDTHGNCKHIDILVRLINEGTMILPVFFGKEDNFRRHIPEEIHGQNGILYSPEEEDKIVNLALESFGRLRSSRKVFISYKRDESSSVAIQLYEALERNNFDVFLDTHSIQPGEPFQEELWHRMTDCDVIIFLNTKNFLTSQWCREEIAEANAKQIGIVQAIWPDHDLERSAEVCFPYQLTKKDFVKGRFKGSKTSKLKPQTIEILVKLVESVRARNLAARQDNLITEFTNTARKLHKKMNLQPYQFITEDVGNNKKRIFIPTIGIPQSINCDQSEKLKEQIEDIENIYLIYDDLRIRKKWLEHLEWLNKYLEVKTIKKQEFEEWLQRN